MYSGRQRGSTSPDFMPRVTGTPSWSRPRTTPSMVATMGWPATVPQTVPALTSSPILTHGAKVPSTGARRTRSPA